MEKIIVPSKYLLALSLFCARRKRGVSESFRCIQVEYTRDLIKFSATDGVIAGVIALEKSKEEHGKLPNCGGWVIPVDSLRVLGKNRHTTVGLVKKKSELTIICGDREEVVHGVDKILLSYERLWDSLPDYAQVATWFNSEYLSVFHKAAYLITGEPREVAYIQRGTRTGILLISKFNGFIGFLMGCRTESYLGVPRWALRQKSQDCQDE